MEEKGKSVKMKMGLFFGYNGESFQGMQYQREHTNTIENVLHEVLVKEGFILQSNASELKKIKWSRGARTDKKVHALLNGLSLKLEISPEYILNSGLHYNKLIHAIN
jgi:tRNA pseudouridine38-40 synthase